MLGTWCHLSGIQLPRLPDLILGDDISHWPAPRPQAPLLRLWTVLRVTTLGVMWQERVATAHDHQHDNGQCAIRLATKMVRETIRRDWIRTQVDIRSLDDGVFCLDWWRGLDCSLSMHEFISKWATPPVLCKVLGGPPAQGQLDVRRLVLLI